MPKTHTDDLAPVLPSSIEGPFQISTPSDPTSWIKIDPAGARIAAGGDGRPTRVVAPVFGRTYGSVTAHYIGTTIVAHYVNAGSTGGFYLLPIRVPDDMDVTQPSSVRIVAAPVQDATTNGQAVRFYLQQTRVSQGGPPDASVVTFDWDVPDDWTTNDCNLVLIDNGNGRTFEGDTFENGDTLGLRIIRMGGSASDTFDKGVKFADCIAFEYTAKEY